MSTGELVGPATPDKTLIAVYVAETPARGTVPCFVARVASQLRRVSVVASMLLGASNFGRRDLELVASSSRGSGSALDRVGRSVLDVLQTIKDLRDRGIGIRTLADPLPVDTTAKDSPMAELAIVLLTLFAQMELTFNRERAAHARSVAASNGRQVGRPSVVDPTQLSYAVHLRDVESLSMTEIAAKTGLARATLYRHMPPRPDVVPTASGEAPPARTEGGASAG